jgi:hypothetical protein
MGVRGTWIRHEAPLHRVGCPERAVCVAICAFRIE